MAKFQSIVDKMANDDPLHLGSWCRDRVLGTGGFGIVTLWKNNKTSQRVGKNIYLYCKLFNYTMCN